MIKSLLENINLSRILKNILFFSYRLHHYVLSERNGFLLKIGWLSFQTPPILKPTFSSICKPGQKSTNLYQNLLSPISSKSRQHLETLDQSLCRPLSPLWKDSGVPTCPQPTQVIVPQCRFYISVARNEFFFFFQTTLNTAMPPPAGA